MKIKIDLRGEDGNAHYILGVAAMFCKELGIKADPILKDMRSKDYKHLLEVFKKHFGEYVELIGEPK